MLLLIDNYDSFVHNLARYFQCLGCETLVVRNDAITAEQIGAMRPEAVVISPGPCTPDRAGCSMDVVRRLGAELPILGVCLGHQALARAMGGRIVRSADPMHGRSSGIVHDGRGVFRDLPNPFDACRYHSLVVEESTLPECFEVSSRTETGLIMSIRHRTLPWVGLQFHPESILTDVGTDLLAGFLRRANQWKSKPCRNLG